MHSVRTFSRGSSPLYRWTALTALLTLLSLLAPTAVRPAVAAESPWIQDSNVATTSDTPEGAISTGSPGEYRVIRQANGRVSWAIWHRENWMEIPGGWTTPVAPDIMLADGQLWVFIHGQNDNNTYYNRLLDQNANRWSGWQVVPGTSDTSGTASAVYADSVWVFTNQGGALYYSQYSFRGPLFGWANVHQPVPGGAYTYSSPGATTYGIDRDRIALFHRGVDNHLYRQNFNAIDRFWPGHWRDLQGILGSRPVAAATGNLLDIIQVTARGTDSRPWLITFGEGAAGTDVVTYNWRPAWGWEGTTNTAPSLFANIALGAIYLIIAQANTREIWSKRSQ